MITAFFIAAREAVHFRLSSLGQVAIVASLVTPILLALSIDHGVVSDLRVHLASNPESLRLRPARSQSHDRAWFDALATDPRVGFLAPHPYESASQLMILSVDGREMSAALLASGDGDPFLPDGIAPPSDNETLLTAIMSANLGLGVGDKAVFLVECDGLDAPLPYETEITGIVERSKWSTAGALVSEPFLVENFLCKQYASELMGNPGLPPPDSIVFPQFRLFAASLEDVRSLTESLAGQGVFVTGQFASADLADSIERTAGSVMIVLILVVSLGAMMALSASLQADARRIRPNLATLRIDGLSTLKALNVLAIKGFLVSSVGCIIGFLAYGAVCIGLNRWIALDPLPFATRARLDAATLATVMAVVIGISLLAAGWAAFRTFSNSPLEDQNAT